MVDGGSGDSVGGGGTAPEKGKTTAPTKKSALEVNGERLRFAVDLRPGETTIVSWRKLLKDNSFSVPNENAPNAAADSVPSQPNPPRLPVQGQIKEIEGKDAPQANRFTTVIEKIERLYVGKGSSDEEDNNDVVPDDDEYDTEDSFIDDAELDEYFEVDNSAIKHDGFFVNRGKLERAEPSQLPNEQPKKRRRKDLAKGHDGSDTGHHPTKDVKVRKKTGTSGPSVGAPVTGLPNIPSEVARIPNLTSASETSLAKKPADVKVAEQPMGFINSDLLAGKATDPQKSMVLPSNSHSSSIKAGTEHSGAVNQISRKKKSHVHSEPAPEKLLVNVGGPTQNVQPKENLSFRERPEVSTPEGKNFMQNAKMPLNQKKDGSSVRQKSTVLDKAIRDLERLVEQSRPSTSEIQETDNASQAIKRRLSPEIKQKLSKVARLAQATQGKLSNELISRLMSIVGHLIQLRTLKRNLKAMVNMGLSAKQEKDNRVQLVKKEVAEMIKTRIPLIQSKVEERAGASDDFQEISAAEKEAFRRKNGMDDALEDKICDLYDAFIEGLEEDAGPQVRKLYAEISALWPQGFMDNHGIKQAICRAKDRRKGRVSKHKDQEKLRRKKMMSQKAEGIVRLESGSVVQQVRMQDASVPVSTDQCPPSVSKPYSSNSGSGSGASSRNPASVTNDTALVPPKLDKTKGVPSNPTSSRVIDPSMTKKIKRKHENTVQRNPMSTGEVSFRLN